MCTLWVLWWENPGAGSETEVLWMMRDTGTYFKDEFTGNGAQDFINEMFAQSWGVLIYPMAPMIFKLTWTDNSFRYYCHTSRRAWIWQSVLSYNDLHTSSSQYTQVPRSDTQEFDFPHLKKNIETHSHHHEHSSKSPQPFTMKIYFNH